MSNRFAAGKGTALVVDIGEDSSSVIPIYDGFVIKKSIKRSPLGGSTLDALVSSALRQMRDPSNPAQPYRPTPQYLIKSRQPVEPHRPPVFTLRTDRVGQATESFARYAEHQLVQEFKETVCEVLPQKYSDQMATGKVGRPFEFPDGYTCAFPPSMRLRLPEVFFDPAAILTPEVGLVILLISQFDKVPAGHQPTSTRFKRYHSLSAPCLSPVHQPALSRRRPIRRCRPAIPPLGQHRRRRRDDPHSRLYRATQHRTFQHGARRAFHFCVC
jgi:hypothetical protein